MNHNTIFKIVLNAKKVTLVGMIIDVICTQTVYFYLISTNKIHFKSILSYNITFFRFCQVRKFATKSQLLTAFFKVLYPKMEKNSSITKFLKMCPKINSLDLRTDLINGIFISSIKMFYKRFGIFHLMIIMKSRIFIKRCLNAN